MDAVSLIVTALASGADKTAKDGASAAVKGTYGALLATVKLRLPGLADAGKLTDGRSAVPEVRDRLAAELAGLGAAGDLVATAQALMWLVDTRGSLTGKYDVDVPDEAKTR